MGNSALWRKVLHSILLFPPPKGYLQYRVNFRVSESYAHIVGPALPIFLSMRLIYISNSTVWPRSHLGINLFAYRCIFAPHRRPSLKAKDSLTSGGLDIYHSSTRSPGHNPDQKEGYLLQILCHVQVIFTKPVF